MNLLNLVLASALFTPSPAAIALASTPVPTIELSDPSHGLTEYRASGLSRKLHSSQSDRAQLQLTDLSVLKNAFKQRQSNIQVLVLGRVVAVLPDDNRGDRHQRFVVKLSNAQTLLVAHNIDQAPRVSNLKVGDQLYIYGEYEWSSKGGTIHWTHRDRKRIHVDGWIQKNGVTFQ